MYRGNFFHFLTIKQKVFECHVEGVLVKSILAMPQFVELVKFFLIELG